MAKSGKRWYRKLMRRKVRRKENDFNESAPKRDKTIGAAARRRWGAGGDLK